MSNRAKGQQAEREVVNLLIQHGFINARRGNQASALSTEADIVSPELDELRIRIEVKISNQFQLDSLTVQKEWKSKAIADLTRAQPHDHTHWRVWLFHRCRRRDWMVWDIMAGTIVHVSSAMHYLSTLREDVARARIE